MQSSPIEQKTILRIRSPRTESFPFCVFLYVLEGEALLDFGTETVPHSAADILFLPPRRELGMSSQDGCRILLFGLSESFVTDHLDARPLQVLSSARDLQQDYLPLKRALLKAAEYDPFDAHLSGTDLLRLQGLIFQLLACVGDLTPAFPGADIHGRYADRVQAIADYIDQHYSENLSLPDLASAFYLTPQYLSVFFSEHFGKNFKTWLTEKRLYYSLRDLRGQVLTVSEIALKNGFASVSAFQKNFRKVYGCSPSEFRSRYLSGGDAGHRAADSTQGRAAFGPAGTAVTLSVNAPARKIPHVNRMINAGSVQNLLSDRFRLNLTSFCRETHIRYVRIEEMLSNSFMPMILPHYEYYYQNADIVLNYLYENGLVPFIELSRAGTQVESAGYFRQEHFYISRNERFFRLLESFLKHVSRRWPVSWLKEWKFEMWMLPRDTASTYAEDLLRVQQLLRSLIPGAQIGGPGYDSSVHTIPPDRLLKTFSELGLRPDCFSAALHYHTGYSEDYPLISRDPDLLVKDCRRYRKLLKVHGENLPLYITSWSSAIPPGAPATASLYQAAFVARFWTKFDADCDLAAYWMLSDADQREGFTGPLLSHFGRGLFGTGFVPYAACFAFKLSASLGCDVLAEGSCYRFVRAEEHHFQLLAFHYVHFRAAADPVIRDAADFDRVYSLFDDAQPLPFSAALTGLVPGLYEITKTSIDPAHGSILDVLIDEFTSSNVDRIEFLRHAQMTAAVSNNYRVEACLPEERSTYLQVKDTLQLQAVLSPHTVCLWDIRRQL